MFARKYFSTKKMVQFRTCVPSGNKDSLTWLTIFIPQDGHAMSSVLTANANDFGHSLRSNMFQSNKTNTGDGEPLLQLGPEAIGAFTLYDRRLDAKVRQNTSTNYPFNNW